MKGRCKQTIGGSYKRDEALKSRGNFIFGISDLKLIIDDDEMEELEKIDYRQARMLERGTGKLRKCKECGDVYVNSRQDEIKWGVWLNQNGFKCYFCRKNIDKPNDKKTKRKRVIMKKVYDLWLEKINEGVTITKNV